MMSSRSSQSPRQTTSSGFYRRRFLPVALALAAALALLSACTAGGSPTTTTGNNTTTSATATTPPTPTPKPKPTSVPTTSVAYCQGLLSLAQANSIMSPSSPATSILFENDSSGKLNACSWVPGNGVAVLAVYFAPFPQGTTLTTAVQQLLPASGGIATTPVAGVGDQALYVSATIPTPSGANYIGSIDAAYGAVLLACAQTGSGTLPAGLQSKLAQACTTVISHM